MQLAGHVHGSDKLTLAQRVSLDMAFDAAIVRFTAGTRIPFEVSISQSDGSWRVITADHRLYVDITLAALTFDPTGALIATPEPEMPPINCGEIYTVHLYFFPDESDRGKFGYNEFYLKSRE